LKENRQLKPNTFEAFTHVARATVIAIIAHFEWEIPTIERETRIYQLLEGGGAASRFLGHAHEHGRIIGFLLEKVEGHSASVEDLSVCEAALVKLHGLGRAHGNVNRNSFLVTEKGAKLIDF
jgi:hypothetical protein